MVAELAAKRVDSPCDWATIHAFNTASFASMEGRITPPSSMASTTPYEIEAYSSALDQWVVGRGCAPVACLLWQMQGNTYYLANLAVAAEMRGQGLARLLVNACATHASGMAVALQLQTRIELLENHAVFAHRGFVVVARNAHPGYA